MVSYLSKSISDGFLSPENKELFFDKDYRFLRKTENIASEEKDKLPCSKPAYIGLFFYGTNNSYRHAIENNTEQESNVARLYDVFPGQCVPGILPPETNWTEDLDIYKRHFKIYVPGVGKAFSNIGDQTHWFKSLFDDKTGAGMAAYGQARIVWALAQVINHIYRYYWSGIGSSVLIMDSEIVMVTENISLINRGLKSNIKEELADDFATKLWQRKALQPSIIFRQYANNDEYWSGHNYKVTIVFREWLLRLKKSINNRVADSNFLPLSKIHFYSFGFSRGAAEARAFLNWFIRLCQVDAFLNNESGGKLSLAGIPIEHDFMGIFDTVASVGLADMFSVSTGHSWWGDTDSLQVPPEVGKCVHFVAAHEQRRCFPLDSVYQGQKLPEYCEEVVFPGVHSDIGGGYAPLDQGKGFLRDGTSLLSRIPLIEMYRRARLAGVPLILEKASTKAINSYKINKKLIDDFNKYLSFFDKKEGTTAEIVTPHWLKQTKFRINLVQGKSSSLESKDRAANIDKDLRKKIFNKNVIMQLRGDKKEISKFNISDEKVYVDRLNLADETQIKSESMLKKEYLRFYCFMDKNKLFIDNNGQLSTLKSIYDGVSAPASYEVKYLVENLDNVNLEKEEEYFIDNYVYDSIAGFCLDGVNEYSISGSFVYFRYRCIFSGSEIMYQVPYGNGFGYSREEERIIKTKEKIERENKERDLQIMQDQMASQFSWDGMMNMR